MLYAYRSTSFTSLEHHVYFSLATFWRSGKMNASHVTFKEQKSKTGNFSKHKCRVHPETQQRVAKLLPKFDTQPATIACCKLGFSHGQENISDALLERYI